MTSSTTTLPPIPRGVALTTVAWLGLALVAGGSGFLARLPFPGPQLIILAVVAATLVAATAIPAARAWIEGLPLRLLVGIHAFRFVGVWFLVLAARGQLAPVFAARAGWGDIAAAALAVVLVAAGDPRSGSGRLVYHAWNAFGLADLIVAVGTATAVASQGSTPGMAPVASLPLSLVPTFYVPLLITSHVFIFRRLRGPLVSGSRE